MALEVCRATQHDLNDLVALEAVTFDYSQMGRRSFQRLLKVRSAHVFVCREHGQLLGYSLLLTRSNSNIWRLYSLAVAAAARGKGVGKRLLEHAIEQAKAQQASALSLEVKTDNKAAIELYRRYDFEVIDVLPDYYPDGVDGYRMRLSLR